MRAVLKPKILNHSDKDENERLLNGAVEDLEDGPLSGKTFINGLGETHCSSERSYPTVMELILNINKETCNTSVMSNQSFDNDLPK